MGVQPNRNHQEVHPPILDALADRRWRHELNEDAVAVATTRAELRKLPLFPSIDGSVFTAADPDFSSSFEFYSQHSATSLHLFRIIV
jgi:hypothetical protein